MLSNNGWTGIYKHLLGSIFKPNRLTNIGPKSIKRKLPIIVPFNDNGSNLSSVLHNHMPCGIHNNLFGHIT